MRIYIPKLCRFISADPLIVYAQQYAWYSGYQFAGNKPIRCIDLDGLGECLTTGCDPIAGPYSSEYLASQGCQRIKEISIEGTTCEDRSPNINQALGLQSRDLVAMAAITTIAVPVLDTSDVVVVGLLVAAGSLAVYEMLSADADQGLLT